MQVKEAKIRFDAGIYKSALVTEAIAAKGYNLHLLGKKKSDDIFIVSQRDTGAPRLFKSTDAALKNARDIGFTEITVKLSNLR